MSKIYFVRHSKPNFKNHYDKSRYENFEKIKNIMPFKILEMNFESLKYLNNHFIDI